LIFLKDLRVAAGFIHKDRQRKKGGIEEVKKNLGVLLSIVGFVAAVGVVLILMTPHKIWSVGTTAGTVITNAGDAGTSASADQPGDMVLTSDNAPTATAASSVTTTVLTGYDVGDLATPANINAGIGANADYAYSVKNLSNGTDTILVTVLGTGATTTGTAAAANWTISIYNDAGTIGVIDGGDTVQATGAGNTNVSFSFAGVASNATLNFIVRLTAPGAGTAFNGDTYTVTTRAQSNNGTADGWDASTSTITANPFSGGFTNRGDQLDDSTTTTVVGPVMRVAMSVNTASELPGNALTYTIRYDNDGGAAATNVTLISAIPNPANVTYSLGTVTTSPHSGATATTQWNTGSLAAPSYVGTEPGTPTTVVALRWTFSTAVAAQENSEGTDTTTGVDGTIPDDDAGQVQYGVTID
jgi:uncharacterized repeat protein (TIGR01451 family)